MSTTKIGYLRSLSEEEILSLYQHAPFCQTWTKTDEGFAADSYESDFFVDTTAAIRDNILELAKTRGISKRQLRRTQGVLSELIMNAERHMIMPFYASFTLACLEDNTLAFIAENSSLERAYEKAKALLNRALDSSEIGESEVNMMSDDLLNQPGKGGMGLWYITTQFAADLWITYSHETKHMKSFCLVRPGGNR